MDLLQKELLLSRTKFGARLSRQSFHTGNWPGAQQHPTLLLVLLVVERIRVRHPVRFRVVVQDLLREVLVDTGGLLPQAERGVNYVGELVARGLVRGLVPGPFMFRSGSDGPFGILSRSV